MCTFTQAPPDREPDKWCQMNAFADTFLKPRTDFKTRPLSNLMVGDISDFPGVSLRCDSASFVWREYLLARSVMTCSREHGCEIIEEFSNKACQFSTREAVCDR
jgi:hypothetical protein